jgi:hypothetical protein
MIFPVGELFLMYLISEIFTGMVMGTLIHWSAPRDSTRRGPFGTGLSITLVGLLAVGPPNILRVLEFGWTFAIVEIVLMWAVFITATVITIRVCDIIHRRRYGE